MLTSHFQALVGTAQIAPRWKTCAGAANSHFGLSVGNMFIHEYFGPEAKVDVSIVYNDSYTPCNEVVGGYTGFTMSVRLSVDKSYVVR